MIATVILSIVFWASGCYTKIGYPPPDYSTDKREIERERSMEEVGEVEEEAYRPTRYRDYDSYEEYYSPGYFYPEYSYNDYYYSPSYFHPGYSYYDYSSYRQYRHHYYYQYDDGANVKKRKEYKRGTINGRRRAKDERRK